VLRVLCGQSSRSQSRSLLVCWKHFADFTRLRVKNFCTTIVRYNRWTDALCTRTSSRITINILFTSVFTHWAASQSPTLICIINNWSVQWWPKYALVISARINWGCRGYPRHRSKLHYQNLSKSTKLYQNLPNPLWFLANSSTACNALSATLL